MIIYSGGELQQSHLKNRIYRWEDSLNYGFRNSLGVFFAYNTQCYIDLNSIGLFFTGAGGGANIFNLKTIK